MALIELFGGETGDDVDKFARCTWSDGPGGVPVLDDVAAWMVGRIVERYDFGDHVGHLLEPVAGEVATPSPDRVVTSATPTDWNPATRPDPRHQPVPPPRVARCGSHVAKSLGTL